MNRKNSDEISNFPKRVFITTLIVLIVNVLIVGFIGSNVSSLLVGIIGVIVILIVWITSVRTTRQWLSERNKTENEFKSLKQQIEFILDATKTHLDIIDSNFNIRYIDPGWQKVYGKPTGKKML